MVMRIVSILVLLDDRLKGFNDFFQVIPLIMFQSLFYWMIVLKDYHRTVTFKCSLFQSLFYWMIVLKVTISQNAVFSAYRFNPCFIG